MIKNLIAVMPAYNERDNIMITIREWLPVVRSCGGILVVVDDGSTDDTTIIVRDLMVHEDDLVLVEKKNGGHGSAVLTGYQYAIDNGAEWIFQTDSDGQTNPSEFAGFWDKRESYDALIGMRTHRGDGRSRVLIENILIGIIRIIFSVKVPDANAPFRLMRTTDVAEFIKQLPSNYAIPNVILTMLFVRNKRRVLFKDISFLPRDKGKNSMNITKIFKIGVKQVIEFVRLKKIMNI